MQNKNISFIALITAVISLSLCVFILLGPNKKKVAFIRSSDLVYGYLGMQEAHNEYQKKAQAWQANIDTLKKDYILAAGMYSADSAKLSEKEHISRQRMLARQEQDLQNYAHAIQQKAKEEDDKITEGVLNQVNSFVEEYGKKRGYDIILGTTTSGNVLYGNEAIDITKEVLEELNKAYTSGETN